AGADDVAAVEKSDDESTAAPEDGLGSVEGEEVEAAQANAAEVHEAAAEGTESAETTAEYVAAEKPNAEPAATPRRRWWRRG
ncbi:MAG: hypothetical protein QOI01_6374, partial [Mycobacterium sp.]|nr:hypothetical protein [Mycobacterium sp.]